MSDTASPAIRKELPDSFNPGLTQTCEKRGPLRHLPHRPRGGVLTKGMVFPEKCGECHKKELAEFQQADTPWGGIE